MISEMPIKSLRIRLSLVATVWLTFGMIMAYFALSTIFRNHAEAQFYQQLDIHAQELQRLSGFSTDAPDSVAAKFSDPRYDMLESGYYWQIMTGESVITSSASLGGGALTMPLDEPGIAGEPHRHRFEGPTGTLLIVERVSGVNAGPREQVHRFIVGTDKRHLDAMVSGFNAMLRLALAGFGMILLISAIGLVWVGLAPFGRLIGSVKALREGEATQLTGQYPSEVEPLVNEMNALLEAGRETVKQSRIQAGNLAHGLKGPLTIIGSQAALLSERGDDDVSRAITEQCQKMRQHIDHQTARARAAAISRVPGLKTNLRQAAQNVSKALSQIHRDSGIELQLDIDQTLAVAVDPQDFNEILANLMDNAFKFATSQIILSAYLADAQRVTIKIEDDGAGLPEEAYGVVLQPGGRWDEHTPGSGLGLAIVADLVDLYRGQLELARSDMGGLLVSLSLPGHIR
jgi:signal transduction histidine kinase